jgi:2-polyprenyl-6-methoxyphenol hydroxylase-like FAD-dependent oxidoreductase
VTAPVTGPDVRDTDVCVVGGGPAGLVAGLLLTRAGVRVTLLEKHADFLRDFRGDTVHPSTLDLITSLGLGDRIAELPSREVREFNVTFGDRTVRLAEFSRLRIPHPYVLFLPQWDLLEMLATAAAAYPTFTLARSHQATELLFAEPDGRVTGVVATEPTGRRVEIPARLVIAADGRDSTVRAALAAAGHGLPRREFGQPMDVLWFRLPRWPDDPPGLAGQVAAGRLMIMIDRGHYWQNAYIIPKGDRDAVVAAGIEAFRASVAALVPLLRDRVGAIASFDDVSFLRVQLDRLTRWYHPGVLLIGDAAHAMSPVGGVGINLAIQDAVAAARMLAGPLRAGTDTEKLTPALIAIQRRRTWPTVATQWLQRTAARGFIGPRLAAPAGAPVTIPMGMRLLDRVGVLRAVLAYVIGVGIRPERRLPPAAAQPAATRRAHTVPAGSARTGR